MTRHNRLYKYIKKEAKNTVYCGLRVFFRVKKALSRKQICRSTQTNMPKEYSGNNDA